MTKGHGCPPPYVMKGAATVKKRGAHDLYRIFLSAYAVVCGLLLSIQCILLWVRGNSAGNQNAGGQLLTPVFSREKTAAMLRISMPVLIGFITTALLGCLWSALRPSVKTALRTTGPMFPSSRFSAQRIVRFALLAAAILLIVLGIANGGMHDVLIKAIMICTECIGLG